MVAAMAAAMVVASRWWRRIGLLACWLLVLSASPLCGSDRLRLLLDDGDALRSRLASIDRAEADIRLACYEIRPGAASGRLLDRLIEQAERGVRVRVLIDGMASAIPADQAERLLRSGVQIRVYHPLLQRGAAWLNRRMHTKLLVVDQWQMIVGSRNLSDSHFGLKPVNHIDYDVLVEGHSCRKVAAYFDSIWDSGEVQPLQAGRVWWLNTSRQPQPACVSSADAPKACELGLTGEAEWPWIETDTLCVLHDLDARKADLHMQRKILGWIDGACSSVVIESPYPAFSTAMLNSLRRASQRGVQISLATNSIGSTDQVAAFAGYQNRKAQLQRWGVRLYEVPGPHHLHAKTLLVDDRLTMMGSYNFDSRSERFNLELCLVCGSTEVAQWLRRSVDVRHFGSTPLAGGGLRRDTSLDAPPLRKLQMRTSQLVVPVIRPLL
jgi:putative cardiolipin synthase